MERLPLIRVIFYTLCITPFSNKIPSQGFASFSWHEPRYLILWGLLLTSLCSTVSLGIYWQNGWGCDPIIRRNSLKFYFIGGFFCLFVSVSESLHRPCRSHFSVKWANAGARKRYVQGVSSISPLCLSSRITPA